MHIHRLPKLEFLDLVGGRWLNDLASPIWSALNRLPRLACLKLQNPMHISGQSLAALNMKALPDRMRMALQYGMQYSAGASMRADIFGPADDGLTMMVPNVRH